MVIGINAERKMASFLPKERENLTKEEYIRYFKRETESSKQVYTDKIEKFASILYDMDENDYSEFKSYLNTKNYRHILRGIDYILPLLENPHNYEKAAIIIEMNRDRDSIIQNVYSELKSVLQKENIPVSISNLEVEIEAIENNNSSCLTVARNRFANIYDDFTTKEISEYYQKLYDSLPDGLINIMNAELNKKALKAVKNYDSGAIERAAKRKKQRES